MRRQEELHLEAGPFAPAEGRRFVAEQCARFGMAELTDTAALLASELVTNTVVHTVSDPTIAISSTNGELLIEVRDDDPELPQPPGNPAREVGEAPGGRGLTLVSRLAAEWGVRPIPGNGKAVWFALQCSSHPPVAPSPVT